MRVRAGYTLIELLVVISIIGFISGISLATFVRLRSQHAFTAEVSGVKTLLRKAQNYSRHKRASSVVIVDPVENALYAKGLQTVGLWHFENLETSAESGACVAAIGANNLRAVVHNAEADRGYMRQGLLFGANEDLEMQQSYMEVPASRIPALKMGVLISLWCFPGNFWSARFQGIMGLNAEPEEQEYEGRDPFERSEHEPVHDKADKEKEKERYQEWQKEMEDAREEYQDWKDKVREARLSAREAYRQALERMRFDLVTKGDSFLIRLTGAYALEVAFSQYYFLKTPDGVLVPNMWNHVKVYYDCENLVVHVNGVPYTTNEISKRYELKFVIDGRERSPGEVNEEIRETAFPDRISANDAPLMISGPASSFYGRIDEVCVRRFVAEEVFRPRSAWIMGRRQKIYFTPQGRLDQTHHSSAAEVVLTDYAFYEPPEKRDNDDKDFRTSVRGFMDAGEALDDDREWLREQEGGKNTWREKTVTVNLNGTIR